MYGLRRALVLAGAETQLVSMWKVDDEATRELMVAYYRALEQGAGRSQAQLAMRRSWPCWLTRPRPCACSLDPARAGHDPSEAFLLWIARGAPEEGVDKLCRLYQEAPPGRPVVPHVDERVVCAGAAGAPSIGCRMLRLLRADKPENGDGRLARSVCTAAR